GVFLGDVGDVGKVDPVAAAQEIQRPADAGQHAERQHIDLHQAHRVDVVLVPLNEGALVHRRVADGDGFVQPPLGQDEAADVLRQVTGELQQRVGQGDGAPDLGVAGVEARLAHVLFRHLVAPAAPNSIGEGGGDVLGQAERLADVADGA